MSNVYYLPSSISRPPATSRLEPPRMLAITPPTAVVGLCAALIAVLCTTHLPDWIGMSQHHAAAVGAVTAIIGLAGIVWFVVAMCQALTWKPDKRRIKDDVVLERTIELLAGTLYSLSDEQLNGLFNLLGGKAKCPTSEDRAFEIASLIASASVEDEASYDEAFGQRVSGLLAFLGANPKYWESR